MLIKYKWIGPFDCTQSFLLTRVSMSQCGRHLMREYAQLQLQKAFLLTCSRESAAQVSCGRKIRSALSGTNFKSPSCHDHLSGLRLTTLEDDWFVDVVRLTSECCHFGCCQLFWFKDTGKRRLPVWIEKTNDPGYFVQPLLWCFGISSS